MVLKGEWGRVAAVALSVAYLIIGSFPIGGHQALLPDIFDSGAFDSLCSAGERGARTDGQAACPRQAALIADLYGGAVMVINLSTLPIGYLLQVVRGRGVCALGAVLVGAGYALLATANIGVIPGVLIDVAWVSGYVLLSSGGTLCGMACASILPRYSVQYSGSISALMMLGFDGSAGTFLMAHLVHAGGAGVPLWLFFVVMAVLSFLFVPATLLLVFRWEVSVSQQPPPPAGAAAPLLGPYFALVIAWAAVYGAAKYFYIATLRDQLLWLGFSDSRMDSATLFFSVALPLSGAASVLVSLATSFKRPVPLLVCAMAVLSGAAAVGSTVPVYWVQYLVMLSMAFLRYTMFALAPYILMTRFDPRRLSLTMGLVFFVLGLTLFVNVGVIWLAVDILESYIEVNLAYGALCVVIGAAMACALLFNWAGSGTTAVELDGEESMIIQ